MAHLPIRHLLANYHYRFDWSDEAIISEAIEAIDRLKITARLRPMVIVGFEGDGWLPVNDFMEIVQTGHESCVVVDAHPDFHRTLSRIEADFGDSSWISILGIARLDLADSVTYRALLAALDDRWAENWLEMPVVEF